jgi:hypothetical protein
MSSMRSDFRIEKVRRYVSVVVSGGGALEGDIFLQPSARYRSGPQAPEELLNEPEAFFPLATEGDQMTLVSKDHVTRVDYDGQPADTEDVGAIDVAVEVVLADGTTVEGDLRLEPRADRPRLLDFLNRQHERFLTIRSPNHVCLVNWRLIAQVRQRP